MSFYLVTFLYIASILAFGNLMDQNGPKWLLQYQPFYPHSSDQKGRKGKEKDTSLPFKKMSLK